MLPVTGPHGHMLFVGVILSRALRENFTAPHERVSYFLTLSLLHMLPYHHHHLPPHPASPLLPPSLLCTLTSSFLQLSCFFFTSLLIFIFTVFFIFFLLSTALNVCVCVCVCVSACLTVCVCSNLSKHSLVWELRDPCVWCVVWEQHEQQIHHTHSCAYTHTQHIHTPQGLIAETTCNSSWI